VAHLLEVALAQPEQDRAVELGVAADEVLLVRLERHPVMVVDPVLVGQVATLPEDLLARPVLRLARQVPAALQHENALAGRREPVGERATPRAGSDDDHVVVLRRHCESS
jgi:hypothetical protein